MTAPSYFRRRAALAPSLPKAVRVFFGKWEIVFRDFAAAAAFLMFAFAARFCRSVAMVQDGMR